MTTIRQSSWPTQPYTPGYGKRLGIRSTRDRNGRVIYSYIERLPERPFVRFVRVPAARARAWIAEGLANDLSFDRHESDASRVEGGPARGGQLLAGGPWRRKSTAGRTASRTARRAGRR